MNKATLRVLAERVRSSLEREARFLEKVPSGHWWERQTWGHNVEIPVVISGLRRMARMSELVIKLTEPVRRKKT